MSRPGLMSIDNGGLGINLQFLLPGHASGQLDFQCEIEENTCNVNE